MYEKTFRGALLNMEHTVRSIRPFIGSKDFGQSRKFYQELGFQESPISAGLSLFRMEQLAFYLQDAYVKDWIDNTMIFVEVENAVRYFEHLSLMDLPAKYPGARLSPVRIEDWGRECFLHDPSGILWHFGEFADKMK